MSLLHPPSLSFLPFPKRKGVPLLSKKHYQLVLSLPFPSIFCRILKYLRFYNLAFCSPNQNACINPVCSHRTRHHVHHVWCFWTGVLARILKSPLGCKEIKPVNPEGNLSWIFIGRTDAKAEAPILWPPDAKNWLIEEDPDAGKDWGQEETGMTEDEMVGWHHRLDGQEFEQAPGVGDGQGSLACCSLWDCRVRHDWVIELNWNSFNISYKASLVMMNSSWFCLSGKNIFLRFWW